MTRPLRHSEVIQITNAIAESKVLDLDASIKNLVQPAAAVMRNIGDEVAIHVLCCNEYGLITAVTGGLDISEVRQELQSLRASIEQIKQGKGG
jgi:hypothetical protein